MFNFKNPKYRNILIRPFTYSRVSLRQDTFRFLCLLCSILVLLIIGKSFHAILNVFSACLASVLAVFVTKKINVYGVPEHYAYTMALIQGMIIGYLVPESYPCVTIFCVTLMTMFSIKHFFGGFSYAWVNPCAFAVCILWLVGEAFFPKPLLSSELLSLRNPSQFMLESGVFNVYNFDIYITNALNNSIFELFGIQLPEGYISLLWDTGSEIPAFRYNFIIILSSVILCNDDHYKLVSPCFFLVIYMLLIRLISPFFFDGFIFEGDILLALFTSGTLFYATFVLSWYGTTPVSLYGKVLYGILGGVVAFLTAGPGTSSIGLAFTVLFCNVFSVLLQQFENKYDKRRVQRLVNAYKKEKEGAMQ